MVHTISIFGLGYVGAVTAGCLAARDRRVIGVDVHPTKIRLLNAGRPSIGEPGLDTLIRHARENGWLEATIDPAGAVRDSTISLVCVGTPSLEDGGLDLRHVENVSRQIRDALIAKRRDDPPAKHTLVYRSTMLPGSTRRLVGRYFADLIAGGSLEVFFLPEFLRQGNAVEDFRDPRISVLGAFDLATSPDSLAGLFPGETTVLSLEAAELVKYACNAFHAVKIAFANEIGRLGKALEVDAREVMRILCRDDRLNISAHYLRPGTPFGGSCLPKDVRALAAFAGSLSQNIPLTAALIPSNDEHLAHLESLVTARPAREIVILGLTFKPDTDDLRGSALVRLAASLLRKGYAVRIFDPWLDPDEMIGANIALAEEQLPQLRSLLKKNLAEALGAAGTVIAANKCAQKAELARLITDRHHVIDINGWPEMDAVASACEGICWP